MFNRLKIRDNVNLKKLKKFGFKYIEKQQEELAIIKAERDTIKEIAEREINKKDKIINEMVNWIADEDFANNKLLIHKDENYIKKVKQYFEKKVEKNNG